MPTRLLLRSAWQTVNIGDIGHTPGALRLLDRYFPEAELTLWPSKVDRGVREQLLAAFPRLKIAEGDVSLSGVATTPELQRAFDESDVLIHGSGPNVMVWEQVEAWRKTGRPYGAFGITFDRTRHGYTDWEDGTLAQLRARMAALPSSAIKPIEREFFHGLSFAFFRDTFSLDYIRREFPGLPHIAFGPDATFACDIRDDARADTYLSAHGLEEKKFICVIPRLRWTPYYKMHGYPPSADDLVKDVLNARTQSADHAGVREMIIRWVRETGLKVLVCPEMTYQVQLGKEELIDPLPADVKANVVWRDTYWLNDEATSVYRKAHTLISLENHSPILAIRQGTPTIFIRQPTDTCKGQMWPDIGLPPDFFEVEDATGDALWARLSAIHADYPAAQARTAAIYARVESLQREMVLTVKRVAEQRVQVPLAAALG
ncbi:MAG: polysaccharide pyruvyl transferase family protein [Burkholderiales bacterium]|nr:polysaccharide pyruvyl transferase family protein [Opitutaceae bacterium]